MQITIKPSDHVFPCDADETVLQAAMRADLMIPYGCRNGACGTCRVEVIEGWANISPPTPDETYKEIEPPYRLSCQCKLLGDIVVKVARIE